MQDKIKDKLGLLELRAALLLKIPGRAGNAEANFRCGLCPSSWCSQDKDFTPCVSMVKPATTLPAHTGVHIP